MDWSRLSLAVDRDRQDFLQSVNLGNTGGGWVGGWVGGIGGPSAYRREGPIHEGRQRGKGIIDFAILVIWLFVRSDEC